MLKEEILLRFIFIRVLIKIVYQLPSIKQPITWEIKYEQIY
jgi:hypothetical protein